MLLAPTILRVLRATAYRVMLMLLIPIGLPRLSLSVLMLPPLGECKDKRGEYGKNNSWYRMTNQAQRRDGCFVKPGRLPFGANRVRKHIYMKRILCC